MIFSTVAGSLLFLGLLSQVPDQADRWTAIRSDEGDFSARMPTKPISSKRQVPTPAGKVEQEIHYCRLNGSLFSVQRIRLGSEIPSGQAAAWLTAQKKSYLAAGARPDDERKVSSDGVIGEEFGYRAWHRTARGP